MKILSIETSCDETALAILEANGGLAKPNFKILGTALYSQIKVHEQYGGVFPSLAKREHAKNLMPLLMQLIEDYKKNSTETHDGQFIELSSEQKEKLTTVFEREPELLEQFIENISKIQKPDFDLIAVTSGPGLEPALWVGLNFARALSLIWDIPVLPVNHMEGHLASVLKDSTNEINFPMIALLISGGHTELVLIKDWGQYEVIGKTLDDAVGEAFDKVARLLDLPYPGGPEISKLTKIARDENLESEYDLPRPMLNSGNYDFSFSGIKTAVLYLVKKIKEANPQENAGLTDVQKKMVALEFENAVTEVLVKKTKNAVDEYSARKLIVGGGVISNPHIRKTLTENFGDILSLPDFEMATDNAVMIAIAGYLKSFREDGKVFPEIRASGNLQF